MVNQYVYKFMRPGYEPGDGSMDGAMLVDTEWWHPMFGCDSLQHVLDNVRYSRVLQESMNSEDLVDDLIKAVEAICRDPDNHKDYEDNYQIGWCDACNAVLELLHSRFTHDKPLVEETSMPELSTAAQAILDAYWTYPWDPARQHEDRGSIAAALRAAASQLLAVQWNGQIPADTTHQLGINWARDALHALAEELEAQ